MMAERLALVELQLHDTVEELHRREVPGRGCNCCSLQAEAETLRHMLDDARRDADALTARVLLAPLPPPPPRPPPPPPRTCADSSCVMSMSATRPP